MLIKSFNPLSFKVPLPSSLPELISIKLSISYNHKSIFLADSAFFIKKGYLILEASFLYLCIFTSYFLFTPHSSP